MFRLPSRTGGIRIGASLLKPCATGFTDTLGIFLLKNLPGRVFLCFFAFVRALPHLLLIFTVLLNSMIYSVVVGNYVINKQEIVDRFCVNKERPEMQCDGKCYLAKQLRAEKDKKERESQHHFSLDFGLYLFDPPFVLEQVATGKSVERKFRPYRMAVSGRVAESFFVPPKSVSLFLS